jgi:DNA-binding response OmpR family regulator
MAGDGSGTRVGTMAMSSTADAGITVLVVEPDPTSARILGDFLGARGYRVSHAGTAEAAERMVDEVQPNAIVLELILPDGHGLVLCANLRAKTAAPIIICSATKRQEDRTLGFKLGADGFIAKPFSIEELRARLEVALHRSAQGPTAGRPPNANVWRVGELIMDEADCRVTLAGEVIHVTPKEYQLLSALASRPDTLLSRKELAERVWGYYAPDVAESLAVHMRRLRGKLKATAAPSPALVAVRGFGYQLVTAP